MKNMKKLIAGVVAMMAVATAVQATPAKVPVEVLDVADAMGIAVSGTVDNETVYTAADNGGYWTVSNGSGDVVSGSVTEEENGVAIRKSTNSKIREVSAGYTTNSSYSYADTKVQFTYKCNTIDAFKGHLIQISSDTLGTTKVSDEIINAAKGLNYVETYYNDSAVLVVLDGQLKYVDPADGAMKDTGFTILEDTNYSFRLEREAGASTYDLYVDTVKIGANSTPVLEDVPLVSPTGKNFKQIRTWLGSSTGAEALNYTVYLSDIRFMQSLTDDKGMVEVVDEKFDARPEGDGWSYAEPTNSKGTKQGTVSANGTLNIGYKSTVTTTREIVAEYVNADMASADKYEVSFEVIPNYTETYAEYFVLMNNGSAALTGDSIPVDTPVGITAFNDSIQVAFADNKIYYGSTEDGVNSYKELSAVTYENNIKYYAKIAVDTVNKKYDLYLSKEPITLATVPVLEDKGFFCPSANTVPDLLSFRLKKHTGVAGAGTMGVDNLVISKEATTRSEIEGSLEKSEGFDALPADTTAGGNWAYYWGGTGKNGSVTASGALTLAYRADLTRTASIFANYTDADIKTYGDYEMSYEIVPELTKGSLYEASLAISADESVISEAEVLNKPTVVAPVTDSIQLIINNDKFAYGCSDETGNYFKDIAEYEYGKTYYVKVKVNNTDKTYTLWISDAQITDFTTPVVENAGFFLPSGTASNLYITKFTIQRLAAGATTVGTLKVDNLEYKKTGYVSPDEFAVMNDDQQYMTSLGTSQYIDLINVPADKEVIVAYYDADNKLVDVAVATADALRASTSDETAVKALVMTWDDFNNIVPANAAIELN